ncbi:MAG: glycosyltransferase [Saprospiraceae bacterium]|nr:glycosyltransferase [Saprospiraceae bacterium]
MNKAIAIINTSGLGGAEKRYLTLFDYFQKNDVDIYLIINRGLLNLAREKGLLLEESRILVLDLKDDRTDSSNSKKEDKSKKAGKLKFIIGRYSSLYKSLLRWLHFRSEIIPLIRENCIDTVYTVWLAGIWLAPIKRQLNLKLIHSFNDSGFSSISNSLLDYFKSEYRILKKADKIDCLSSRLKTGLIGKIKGLKADKLSVSPCSFIDYSDLYSEKKENRIIFSGRLEKIKNPLLFLESVNLIKEHLKDEWNIFILGDGSLYNVLDKYIQDNDLYFVELKGYVSNPQEYLRKSKIYVSLQQEDNYPSQALMEAMACENAIIASDVGETRLLIIDTCGILVNLNDSEISKSLLNFINNEKALSVMGKSARKKVIQEHNIEDFSEYINQLL